LVQRRDRAERTAREEPNRCAVLASQSIENDLDDFLTALDPPNDILIGVERIRARAFGDVAELRQTSWKTRVEDDEQLVGEKRGSLPGELGIEELCRELIFIAAAGIQEPQNGSSWRVAAERIFWCRRLRR
jgi:hypothetical protein